MFNHNHYVPSIKWKQGERTALENLTRRCKEVMTPLIEIPFNLLPSNGSPIPSKTLDEHIGNTIGQDFRSTWGLDSPIFLDTLALDNAYYQQLNNGQHFLPYIVGEIESCNTPVIPVTTLQATPTFVNELQKLINTFGRGLCIRIKQNQLSDLNSLFIPIHQFINSLGLNPSNIDLIFDFGRISEHNSYYNQVINLLIQLPNLSNWRTLTVLATSLIEPLPPTTKNSISYYNRVEWADFLNLRKIYPNISRIPAFGDYVVGKPEHKIKEIDFMRLIPKAVYTTDREYILFRGEYRNTNNFHQYYDIADSIVSHPDYFQNSYSYGDNCIFDHHSTRISSGSPMTWIRYTSNHHLTKVADDISNFLGI